MLGSSNCEHYKLLDHLPLQQNNLEMHHDDIVKYNQKMSLWAGRHLRGGRLWEGLGQAGGPGVAGAPELPGPAITPVHSTITVCSAQSESDHSATQRERRVAQQDARPSQAKVKPKLSVGVAYPTVQLWTATSWRDRNTDSPTQCDTTITSQLISADSRLSNYWKMIFRWLFKVIEVVE